MKLNSFREFSNKLRPRLDHIKSGQRQGFLKEAHDLARLKARMEENKEEAGKKTRSLRKLRMDYERVIAHLNQALKSIEQARKASFYPQLLEDLDVEDAVVLLKSANADLSFLRDLSSAEIHPDLRTYPEKKTTVKPVLDPVSLFPSNRVAVVDYWFIGKLGRILDGCQRPGGRRLRSVDYYRIISATFDAAFNEPYDERRVKTALRRIGDHQEAASK